VPLKKLQSVLLSSKTEFKKEKSHTGPTGETRMGSSMCEKGLVTVKLPVSQE
jgi:hypothetical protein